MEMNYEGYCLLCAQKARLTLMPFSTSMKCLQALGKGAAVFAEGEQAE